MCVPTALDVVLARSGSVVRQTPAWIWTAAELDGSVGTILRDWIGLCLDTEICLLSSKTTALTDLR